MDVRRESSKLSLSRLQKGGKMKLRELTNEVARTGMLDVSEEKVLEYQDLIGHASVEENQSLLNSTLMESYLRIYGVAYGTNAALRYYLQNSDAQREKDVKIASLERDIKARDKRIEELEDENTKYLQNISENSNLYNKLERERGEWEQNYHVLQEEMIKLKARLYDMLEAQGR